MRAEINYYQTDNSIDFGCFESYSSSLREAELDIKYVLGKGIDWREGNVAAHGEVVGESELCLVEVGRVDASEGCRTFGRVDLGLELALPLGLGVLFPVVEVVVVHVDHFRLLTHLWVNQSRLFALGRQSPAPLRQVFRLVVQRRVIRLVFRVLLRRTLLSHFPTRLLPVLYLLF